MTTFLFSFAVMLVAGLAMAVGVLLGRRSLKGSCGGLSSIEGAECPVCSEPCAERRRADASRAPAATGHS